LLAAQLLFVLPSLGQDVGDLDALQEVIDQQQGRLNDQEAELARQKPLGRSTDAPASVDNPHHQATRQ